MDKPRIVIVGAGFAGLAAAKAFKGKSVDVTLIDRTNHHLFQPLLYQVATGGLNPSEIASPVRSVLKRQKNVTTLMGSLHAVDYQKREASFDEGKLVLSYDYLLLAMGGRTSYFGNDNWSANAPGLKSLDDALTIRQRVLQAFEDAEKCEDEEERRKLMTVAVVGGGPTGVEMAGSLAELRHHVLRWDFRNIDPQKARVILIEGGSKLLNGFPERLSDYAAQRLEKMGVEVLFGERVQDIQPGVVITDKRTLSAQNVVWAAGVGGHELASDLSSKQDRAGRVVVQADLRLEGQERVYCLGDMANYQHDHTFDGKALPGVAPVASQQGRWAAKNVLNQISGKSTKEFRYFDKGSMATIGRTAAVCATPKPLPFRFTGFIAWVAWLFVHLLYLVDFKNRLIVLFRWGWKYLSWRWNARLITRPEPAQGKPTSSSRGKTEESSQSEVTLEDLPSEELRELDLVL